jgi:hypothetical protein
LILEGTWTRPEGYLDNVDDTFALGNYCYSACGLGGLKIFDCTAGSPQFVSSYPTSGWVTGIWVSGQYAYLAEGSYLEVVNVADPAAPVFVAKCNTAGDARKIYISGNFAYIANGSGGMAVFNISDPAAPAKVGSYATTQSVNGIYVSGNYAYLAAQTQGLVIVNISTPNVPTYVATYFTTGLDARDVEVMNNYAYTATTTGLKVLDISNPAAPLLAAQTADVYLLTVEVNDTHVYVNGSSKLDVYPIGGYDTGAPPTWTRSGQFNIFKSDNPIGLYLNGSRLYAGGINYGISVMDVSSPGSPVFLGGYYTRTYAYEAFYANGLTYMADGDLGLRIIDTSNLASPVLLTRFPMPECVYSVFVAGNFAYVGGNSYMYVVNVSNPSNPAIVGSYSTFYQGYDIEVRGNYAYVASSGMGFRLLDISNPASITQKYNDSSSSVARAITLSGNYAFVVSSSKLFYFIYNIANPNSVIKIGTGIALPDHGEDISAYGNLLCVTSNKVMKVYDITNPESPVEKSTVTLNSYCKVKLQGQYAYVTDYSTLKVYNLTDPLNPVLSDSYTNPNNSYENIYLFNNYLMTTGGSDETAISYFSVF